MFTGIIEHLALVEEIKKNPADKDNSKENLKRYHTEIVINLDKFKGLKIGDSIAINGVCLTIAKINKGKVSFQAIDETIKKTGLSSLKKGEKVNIERSLKVDGRLEGHFVLGHVDTIGIIKKIEKKNKESKLTLEIKDKQLVQLVVQKGSIAIDGISLTVVKVLKNIIEIAIIPHTLENTTIGLKKPGDLVNIEVDVLARYISKIYQKFGNNKKNSKLY